MKRDMVLIRKMALAIEDAPNGGAPDPLDIPGYGAAEIGYHAYLMIDAGLAKGYDDAVYGTPGPFCRLTHLTSMGHDFAAAARNDTIWRKVMITVEKKTGTVTVAVLTDLLKNALKIALTP